MKNMKTKQCPKLELYQKFLSLQVREKTEACVHFQRAINTGHGARPETLEIAQDTRILCRNIQENVLVVQTRPEKKVENLRKFSVTLALTGKQLAFTSVF